VSVNDIVVTFSNSFTMDDSFDSDIVPVSCRLFKAWEVQRINIGTLRNNLCLWEYLHGFKSIDMRHQRLTYEFHLEMLLYLGRANLPWVANFLPHLRSNAVLSKLGEKIGLLPNQGSHSLAISLKQPWNLTGLSRNQAHN